VPAEQLIKKGLMRKRWRIVMVFVVRMIMGCVMPRGMGEPMAWAMDHTVEQAQSLRQQQTGNKNPKTAEPSLAPSRRQRVNNYHAGEGLNYFTATASVMR
jgi:hypothetical protein